MMKVKILECDDWPELVGMVGEVWETYDDGGEFDLRVNVIEMMDSSETWSFVWSEVEVIDDAD
jgi:hypothetical protein